MKLQPKYIYSSYFIVKSMAINSEYKELVDLVSEENLNLDFPNSSIEHAIYVISKIIQKTKNNLSIYSRNLDNDVFGSKDILNSLKNNPHISLKILLDNPDNMINKFKSISRDFKFKKTKEILKNSSYFLVSDNTRVRICSREKPHQAEVNFNSPKGVKLSEYFDQLWGAASPIE